MGRLLKITLAAALILIGGCGDIDEMILVKRRSDAGDMSGKKHYNKPGGGGPDIQADTTVFMTTVEFPPDYDWQRDSAGEERTFHLCVYRNNEKILSLPGGAGTFISNDPDMHRLVGSHIYTDFSTLTQTVICRDGVELFRYDGREMICGFLVKGQDVYTLGQNRTGRGLSLRKNGEYIFGDGSGVIFGEMANPCSETGALYEDGKDLVFFFQHPGSLALMEKTALYLVRNKTSSRINLANNIQDIYDVRLITGMIFMAVSQIGYGPNVALYAGGNLIPMVFGSSNQQFGNTRLRWYDTNVYVKTDYSTDMWETSSSVMWDKNRTEFGPDRHYRVLDYYIDNGNIAYVYTSGDVIYTLSRMYGETTPLYMSDTDYCLMSSNAAVLSGNTFYVGLSPTKKRGRPLIVKNRMWTELKINGYISSIKLRIEEATDSTN